MAALTKSLAKEYSLLYESCLIRPKRKAAIGQVVRRLTSNQARYEKVAKALKMPWYVVAVIHQLEAGGDFTRHLHNGDPLSARTTHVPAGRPTAEPLPVRSVGVVGAGLMASQLALVFAQQLRAGLGDGLELDGNALGQSGLGGTH